MQDSDQIEPQPKQPQPSLSGDRYVPKLTPRELRSRLGRLCIAIVARTAADMICEAELALHDTSFLELRLDYLDQPLAALPALQSFLARHPQVLAIATCRRSENGGRFPGTLNEELRILQTAAEAGFQLIDLEIESAEAVPPLQLQQLRSLGSLLIVSYHDFRGTGDLDQVLSRISGLHPDITKIVPTAQSLSDNLTLLHLLRRTGIDRNLVSMSMGEQGVLSRVLGPSFGSLFTFASTGQGAESAPGQIPARTLLDLYRLDHIDSGTRAYGVAGNHVGSSLSPLMHNTAFRCATIHSVYLPLQVAEVPDLLRVAQELPLHGFSVTMPFKQAIVPCVDRMDVLSARVGAVNTVLRDEHGKLSGWNTDVDGITVPLERRLSLHGARVLLLGAGGAARAAAFGLRDKGADVAILNRTVDAARALADEAGASLLQREHLTREHFDVIVNATPIGMSDFSNASPLTAEEIRADLVFDLVYNPLETPLLALARQAGIACISGVEMFVAQGAKQFELWTGTPAPVEEMTRAVLDVLTTKQARKEESSTKAVSN